MQFNLKKARTITIMLCRPVTADNCTTVQVREQSRGGRLRVFKILLLLEIFEGSENVHLVPCYLRKSIFIDK